MVYGLDTNLLIFIVLALVLAGVAIGFFAGFFGVGGGAISVPVFFEVFRVTGHVDDVAMPLAVGTSLAMIVPTSFLSAREHALRGSLDSAVLKVWVMPIVLGVVTGSVLAGFADAWLFQCVFMLVAGGLSVRLLLAGHAGQIADELPGLGVMRFYGGVVGLLSALMGIGGGALSTIILTSYGRTIHQAVSTSSGVGFLIAVPGTVGYCIAGWANPETPTGAVGYVSLLAVCVTLPTALLMTRVGVRAAHTRSRTQLSRLFGVFLLLVALRFLMAMLFGF